MRPAHGFSATNDRDRDTRSMYILPDVIINRKEDAFEIAPAPAGPDGRTVLIVVKPRECDITTNLVLATDRRRYDLTLDSPPCRGRSNTTSTARRTTTRRP